MRWAPEISHLLANLDPAPQEVTVAEPFNAASVLAELVDVEAGLEVLGRQKVALRKSLEDEARNQYALGTVPSWKVRGTASATLSGAGLYEPVVTDPVAWGEWVGAALPHQAEYVIRIPATRSEVILAVMAVLTEVGSPTDVQTATEVRSGTLKALAENAPADGESCPIIAEGGEVVPGVELVRKSGHLAVVIDKGAKARAVAALEHPPILAEAFTAAQWCDGDRDRIGA